MFLIGSFQKDTEGNSKDIKPKLSKGPDLFIKIIKDIKNNPYFKKLIKNKEIVVVLSGLRRNYIIEELNKNKIKYFYFEMIPIQKLNELYNILDLYIVSSRFEGGPRSIIDCGLTKTPLISTNVGISNNILHKSSIFDQNNILTFRNAIPNTEIAYNNSLNLNYKTYLPIFYKNLFNKM
jgi:hypothetical protein